MDKFIKEITDLITSHIPEGMDLQEIKFEDPYNPYTITLVLKPRDTKPRTL